ncbi:hypothetical protein [Haloplasma contractile]|uniref:hypothetical protein n=1 Tax=Haloplasma contractile TaxID=471825 RepID=UPI00021221F0|nr:hypothetical protein [Haloplasma contractile]
MLYYNWLLMEIISDDYDYEVMEINNGYIYTVHFSSVQSKLKTEKAIWDSRTSIVYISIVDSEGNQIEDSPWLEDFKLTFVK